MFAQPDAIGGGVTTDLLIDTTYWTVRSRGLESNPITATQYL